MTSVFAMWASALLALGGSVTEVTITPMASQTSVLIAVDGDVEVRDFLMEGPHRLVIDLMDAQNAMRGGEFADVNRGGIRSVRSSQYSEDVVRVVFVLEQRLGYTIMPDSRGIRISLQNPAGDFEPWSSGAPAARPFAPASLVPAPQEQQAQARRMSITFVQQPINDVLLAFASYSGRSIVPGSNVTGFVTADINNQPWDVALRTILEGQGLVATEDEYGIIRVDNITDLNSRETIEPILTRTYRISFAPAGEVQASVAPLLTERGQVTVGQQTNTLIVSDIARVQDAVSALLRDLDVQTPQVTIQAKIIFVNRTDLNEMGVTYELKDSRGNQFNQLSDGQFDSNGDGFIQDDEIIEQGEAVVGLGGNSIAALGNATARVAAPTLSLLTTMVIGRHSLIGFLDVLESVNLSDIEATPQVTVIDNQQAQLHVGELTPIRTIDVGADGGSAPTAQVEQQETGVILRATPHVTADDHILLELEAERSAAELAESDAGFIFRTQNATTRVLVRDGETVVIGGLTQSERTEGLSGIPILQDLPLIGRLFQVRRVQNVQRDLIILVTPHIVRGSGG